MEGALPTAPFAGLKVLDLAWVVAGPAIGRVLADFGATVIRVESSLRVDTARILSPHLGGALDPQRAALYDTYNTNKLGLALDLARPEAREVILDLARWADVAIESFVPGQMAKWGLAPETLGAANPRLIGLSTSLMGQTGPSSTLAGYGNVGAAMSGYQSIVGREGETPIGPLGPYTDYVGPRFGLLSLLAALDHRDRTGEACWLDISQAEAGICFLAPQVADAAATGRVAAPMGNRDARFAPHGVFPCAGEDAWIAIAVETDAQWAALAGLVGGAARDPRFATAAARKGAEDELEALVETWTRGRAAADLEASLQAAGVPAHRAADSADMIADPQLDHRGHWIRLPHPLGGESLIEASRFRLSDTPPQYRLAAPHYGRDNRQVLGDLLGYDAAQIAALESAGILR